MPHSPHLSRSDFVKVVTAFLGSIMGLVVGIPAIGYLISPARKGTAADDWIPLGPLENYPLGVPTLFNFTRTKVNGWERTVNSYGVFVIRKSDHGCDRALEQVHPPELPGELDRSRPAFLLPLPRCPVWD